MSEAFERKRVVITGIGTVTSYGDGVETFWKSLLAGKSGIDTVKSFDVTDYPSKVGSECLHFNAGQYMDPKEARRNDRYTQFAVAASRLALKDAGLEDTSNHLPSSLQLQGCARGEVTPGEHLSLLPL